MARPWTPQEDLPGVRVVMDIRAGRSPASGATASWASQFGSKTASQGTAANQPTYSDTALGAGRPGLSFDGTDFLGGLAVDATSTSRTVVTLASFGATNNRTIVGGTADGHYGFRRNNSRQMQVVASNAAAVATDTVVVPDNTPVILASRYTQATIADFRQNGRQTTSATPAGNAVAASAVMQIGAALGGQQMIGAIGAIVIADAYVTDDDVARVEGWLAHANGAAALLVDGHPYKGAPPTVGATSAPVIARGDATLGSLGGSSSARTIVKAQGVGLLGALAGAAAARAIVKATASVVLSALTGSSTARAPVSGNGAGMLAPLNGEATARVLARATGNAALGELTGAARGTVTASPPIIARGDGILAVLTGSATARAPVKARAYAVLGALTAIARAGLPVRTPASRIIRLSSERRVVRLSRQHRVVRASKTGAIMAKWPTKHPDDVLDYAIDWNDRLEGDTIASAQWIVPEDFTPSRESFSGAMTTVWLAGGLPHRSYDVTCRVTTSAGRVHDAVASLYVST